MANPASAVEVIDADISTVSGAADKVLRVHGPPDEILHFDFQTGPDASKPCKLNLYNSVLEDRTGLPVRTVFVLLRPSAFLRAYTGRYEQALPNAPRPYRYFSYDVLKVWEAPPERFLAGIGTLPLAPISAVAESDLPQLLKEMKARLRRRLSRSLVQQIWTSTCLLLGLRYESEVIMPLIEGVLGMEESTTYRAIIQQRRTLRRHQGTAKGAFATRRSEISIGPEQEGPEGPDGNP